MSDPLMIPDPTAGDDLTEMSFSEIYASAAINDEIILHLHPEHVETTKTGLKNYKAKTALKMKKEGLLPDAATLTFREDPSTEYPGCIALKVILERKGTVPIKGMTIPEQL